MIIEILTVTTFEHLETVVKAGGFAAITTLALVRYISTEYFSCKNEIHRHKAKAKENKK